MEEMLADMNSDLEVRREYAGTPIPCDASGDPRASD
jgi:hypothetical protein